MKAQQISNEMWAALHQAIENYSNDFPQQYEFLREYITNRLIAFQDSNGQPYNFSKDFRHETTPAHGVFYSLASTVKVNSSFDANVSNFSS